MIGKKISKSKSVDNTNEADFAVLDNAVSELAMQTEALLGKSGEKMSKPKLPKKTIHHGKAKSFDIIHEPKTKKRTASVLKSAQPSQKLLEPSEEKLVASPADLKETDANSTALTQSTTEVVSGHSSGSLNINDETSGIPAVAKLESDDVETKEPVLTQKADAVIQPTESAPEDDSLTKTKPDLDDKETKNDPESDDLIDLKEDDTPKTKLVEEMDSDKTESDLKVKSDTDTDKNDVSVEADTGGSEIYSDNLRSDPVTFDEETDEPKVAVFDTEEYHSTLHDWSKLEHHNRAPIVLLLVLAIVLAGGVYIVVSGISMPIPF
ncbi:hypothetical protein KBD20_00615 [Candidatus Saccharibacteria bacterium]|nr:hypothetical protein [Candidatus Saccharibacteria bacterium]